MLVTRSWLRGCLRFVSFFPAGGEGGTTNPEELFAAGYSACFNGALQFKARAEEIACGPSTTTAHCSFGEAGHDRNISYILLQLHPCRVFHCRSVHVEKPAASTPAVTHLLTASTPPPQVLTKHRHGHPHITTPARQLRKLRPSPAGLTDSGVGLAVKLHVVVEDVDNETATKLAALAHGFCPYSKATNGNIDVEVIAEGTK
jgi:organic hydroperoxide reductase OsmC/OhrA